jgi:fatty-acyl-CoA synthase
MNENGISTGVGPAAAGAEPTLTPGWHAARTPDRPAIVMAASGEVVTYAQLEERSNRFARALRARGLTAGDHLAILLENTREFLEIAWAAQRSGLYQWEGHDTLVG